MSEQDAPGKYSGQRLHGYRFLNLVTHGGYAAIYRGFQLIEQRDVAIKVMLPKFVADVETIKRFRQEAQIINELNHPNIVPLYDTWYFEDRVFMVMPWMSGGTVRDQIETQGALPVTQVVKILEQITGALEAAHAAKIIHRDIKPPNILFDKEGNAYLTDFGLAKKLDMSNPITVKGMTIGSIRYLSPEQIMDTPISPRTDIYGLGVTVYECLTGEHPYGEFKSELKWMAKVIQDKTPPINTKNPAFTPALGEVIIRATAKNPAERQGSVREFLDEFKAAVKSPS